MFDPIRILLAVFIILFITSTTQAELADNSLKVNLVKYDPYPVNPGSNFIIWVQAENVGDNDINGGSIEFIPKYPFSIKPDDTAIKYPGIIRKKDDVVYTFNVHVDKNAFIGTNSIEVGYRINGILTKREFDIEVGSEIVNSRGTVIIAKYAVLPSTLMAGDNATVTLTLKNSASAYSIKLDDKDYSMNAQIQSAELYGNDFISMLGEQYQNTGIVGPGDSVELLYPIKVNENATDGTYFLDFNLKGNAKLYTLNLKIPVKVDSSSIQVALAETPDLNTGKLIINVANNRPEAIQAVTVIPSGNAVFEPSEYFIGTMEPDELFTIKFNLKTINKSDNIHFRLKFKNGNNWHDTEAMVVKLNNTEKVQPVVYQNTFILPAATILIMIVVLIAGFFVYKRRRKARVRAENEVN